MNYIIKSGAGYFLYMRSFYSDEHLDMPYLTSNISEATRLTKKNANIVTEKFNTLGWEAELIKAKKVKYE